MTDLRVRTFRNIDRARSVVPVLFSLALALIPAATVAAQVDEPVVIGTTTTLRSEILDEDRQLLIFLPYGYEQSTERYPVLYLLDGPAHFHHVTGTAGFLDRADRIPPMIVVGIVNTDRDRDTKPPASVTSFTADARPRFLYMAVDVRCQLLRKKAQEPVGAAAGRVVDCDRRLEARVEG
jgi:hypothetical protein